MALFLLALFAFAGLGGYALVVYLGKRNDTDPTAGASVEAVLGPAGVVGAFLLGLVLVGAAQSYTETDTLIKQEAAVVDNLYESADYVQDEQIRQRLHAATVCYARAVVGPEWDALRRGEVSEVPGTWTGIGEHGLRTALHDLGAGSAGFEGVLAQDLARGDLNGAREAKLTPSTPNEVYWFLVVLLAISLGAVGFSLPREKNRPQLIALVLVVFAWVGLMLLVYSLDRPYSGRLGVKPTTMAGIAKDIEAEYEEGHTAPLPCDERGNPTEPA